MHIAWVFCQGGAAHVDGRTDLGPKNRPKIVVVVGCTDLGIEDVRWAPAESHRSGLDFNRHAEHGPEPGVHFHTRNLPSPVPKGLEGHGQVGRGVPPGAGVRHAQSNVEFKHQRQVGPHADALGAQANFDGNIHLRLRHCQGAFLACEHTWHQVHRLFFRVVPDPEGAWESYAFAFTGGPLEIVEPRRIHLGVFCRALRLALRAGDSKGAFVAPLGDGCAAVEVLARVHPGRGYCVVTCNAIFLPDCDFDR
mmetsp:Transcript_94908/g.163727  ORF Transcript_94908/g.163727 Transcript_94908/m.163727 type:complete len:251 (-) Transcript_94908:79-831(-)